MIFLKRSANFMRVVLFCAQTLRRIDADIVPVSVNSHSWQTPIPQPPVLVILRTTYLPLIFV